jgi:hypothetical protein
MRLALAFLAGLIWAGSAAEARQHYPARGHRIVAGTSMPLDGITAPSGAYSFRKLRSAYVGPAVRIRRASDNAELDINFLGCTGFTGCPIDTAAANAHCAATTCFVRTLYDQSGIGRDIVQASAASQPGLQFNCIGALPCTRVPTAGGAFMLSGASITPATGVLSISMVASRSTGVGSGAVIFRANGATGNRVLSAGANTWNLSNNTVTLGGAATDGVAHAYQGVINGASSVVNVDGTETTGSLTPVNVTAGTLGIAGLAGSVFDTMEIVLWDNVVNDAAVRTFLRNNQKSFWGTP